MKTDIESRLHAKSKHNCSTCIHGFQWGYQSSIAAIFNCYLDNHPRESYLFISCKNWMKRTVKNAKKFKGVFYVHAGDKFMNKQFKKIGKEHGWL
jgi:hypothetical protein